MDDLLLHNDIKIKYLDYCSISDIVKKSISTNSKLTISYVNVYVANILNGSNSFRNYANNIDLLYPDGIGMHIYAKCLGLNVDYKNRINATDLNLYLIEMAAKENWSIAIYGGDEEAIKLLKTKLPNQYSKMKVNKILSRNININQAILEINKTQNDILFLGLGTPIQEKILSQNRNIINSTVIISVGSFIEFLSGYHNRAPLWMRKIGLEWLFRLILEPKRLWKRYLIGIPIFIIRIVVLKFKPNEN